MHRHMKAVFRYPGSKWNMAEWIIQHFPENYEKMMYLEPFCGSGAVFFNKKPGPVETVNDLDSGIVNLFKVLRDKPEELKNALRLTPYSREEYEKSYLPSDDPLESARRFMVRTTQAIGAKMGTRCGWRNHKQLKIGGTACKWGGVTGTIDAAANRLWGDTTHLVMIEHKNALELIKGYNSADTLMYLDPPYLRETRKSGRLYAFEMKDDQHREMLELIRKSKAKIILSGYPSNLYDQALAGWHTDETIATTTSTSKATEKIWMNYEPPAEQLRMI